jgi:hypothetical protein
MSGGAWLTRQQNQDPVQTTKHLFLHDSRCQSHAANVCFIQKAPRI